MLLLAGPAVVFFPVILGAGAAVGLAAGAAAGSQVAVPVEQAAAIERMAAEAVQQLRLPELTAAAIASAAKRSATREATVVDPAAQPDAADFRALRERGFGAAIPFKVKEVGFKAVGAETVMTLFMTAEASLVDTSTGKPVAMRGLVYVSPPHAHRLWTQDDAALTKAEVVRAYTTLAERIVEDFLLLVDSGFEDRGAYFNVCGLAPIRPSPDCTGWASESTRLAGCRAESVTPTLAWEKTPALPEAVGGYKAWNPSQPSPAAAPKGPWDRSKSGDITYDLRIWSVVDGAPDVLVYERQGLPEPQHRIETALAPESTYFWSVRMRYVVDGHLRATRWSSATAGIPPDPQLEKALKYSRADGDTLKPAVCTACRCLDFIPARSYFQFRTP